MNSEQCHDSMETVGTFKMSSVENYVRDARDMMLTLPPIFFKVTADLLSDSEVIARWGGRSSLDARVVEICNKVARREAVSDEELQETAIAFQFDTEKEEQVSVAEWFIGRVGGTPLIDQDIATSKVDYEHLFSTVKERFF